MKGMRIGATRIGLICEGRTDEILAAVLLRRIARDKAGFHWPIDPVRPEDAIERLPLRRSWGQGAVVKRLQKLVKFLERNMNSVSLFVVLLDYKHNAREIREVRRLIGSRRNFILGIPIQEIEAWWLADRRATLGWLGLANNPRRNARYWAENYRAEKDSDPKRTLDELTRLSSNVERTYGRGSVDLAQDFARMWEQCARLGDIKAACPKGFKPFCKKATAAFQRLRSCLGGLF